MAMDTLGRVGFGCGDFGTRLTARADPAPTRFDEAIPRGHGRTRYHSVARYCARTMALGVSKDEPEAVGKKVGVSADAVLKESSGGNLPANA